MAEKKDRYRTPANEAVDAGTEAAKKAAARAKAAAKRSAQKTSSAAAKTQEKERQAKEEAMGYGARKRKEAEKNKPQAAKPKPIVKGDYKSKFAGARDKAFAAASKIEPKAPTPTPVPRASTPAPQAPKSSAGKATPKASTSPGKASPASETYKEGGKGLYQGTKAYREKIGGSGNPLLNRFREDMGRSAKTGEVKKDKNMGPVADGNKYGRQLDRRADRKAGVKGQGPVASRERYGRMLNKTKASPAEKQKQQTQQNRKEQTNKVVKSGSAMSLAEKLRRKRVGLD